MSLEIKRRSSYNVLDFFQNKSLDILLHIATYLAISNLAEIWRVCKLLNHLHLMPLKLDYRLPKRKNYVDVVSANQFWCATLGRILLDCRNIVQVIDFDTSSCESNYCIYDSDSNSTSNCESNCNQDSNSNSQVYLMVNSVLKLFPRVVKVYTFDFLTLSVALKESPNIKTLIVGTNSGSLDCMKGLAKDCQFIESLETVFYTDICEIEYFVDICKLLNLRYLETNNRYLHLYDVFQNIRNLKFLETLVLQYCFEGEDITVPICRILNELPCLTQIIVQTFHDGGILENNLRSNIEVIEKDFF